MATMVTQKCQRCKTLFEARLADVKRGWGKFCSKSCKAIKQEARTGQYKKILKDRHYHEEYGGIPSYDKNGDYEGFTAIWTDEDFDSPTFR